MVGNILYSLILGMVSTKTTLVTFKDDNIKSEKIATQCRGLINPDIIMK